MSVSPAALEGLLAPVRHLLPLGLDLQGFRQYATLDAWGDYTDGLGANGGSPWGLPVRCVVYEGLEVFLDDELGATVEAALLVLAAESTGLPELKAAAALLFAMEPGITAPREAETTASLRSRFPAWTMDEP